MNEAILQFKDIDKSFFGVPVLKDIDLAIREGSILGLIGENGAGKSTLMNILGGVVPHDAGHMLLRGDLHEPENPAQATDAGIAFIHQELNLFTNLSIAENFFISNFPTVGKSPILNKRAIRAKSREYLDLVDLELSPDTPVERLSPGERQLVEVAKALSQDAEIIIFDEPTTSLTTRETARLFDIIKRLHESGKTLIYISHILRDVIQLADDIAILRDGELVSTGPQQDYSIRSMISAMVGREIDQLYPERAITPADEVTLEVRNLSKAGIVEDINFSLHKGEILGLFGLMGSGRSELAQIIFGLDRYDRGTILLRGKPVKNLSPQKSIRSQIAFVTENRREEGLLMNATVADNLGLVSLPDYAAFLIQIVRRSALGQAVNGIVNRLRIRTGDPFKHQAKGLSGGNQQKTVLGKWLMAKPTIMIVDEPTRGVDIGAKYEIYSILNDISANGASVLFISSEIEELIGVCDRIMVMGYGEVLGTYDRAEFDKEQILRTAFREHN